LGTIAQLCHFVAKESDCQKEKKTKAFYDWATTGIPVTRRPRGVNWVAYIDPCLPDFSEPEVFFETRL
jgi:hypothetical protein